MLKHQPEIKPTASFTESSRTDRTIIGPTVIPVLVFVIFVDHRHADFTINDLIRIFNNKHKVKLSFARMQQICRELVLVGKLASRPGISSKNTKATLYQFETL